MPDITPLTYAQANRRALTRMLAEMPEEWVIERMSVEAALEKVNSQIPVLEAEQSDDDLNPCYGTHEQVAKRNRKLTRRCLRLREENARLRETLRRVVAHSRNQLAALRQTDDICQTWAEENAACAAGPWHPASETPKNSGIHIVHLCGLGSRAARWTGLRWESVGAQSDVLYWAEIREQSTTISQHTSTTYDDNNQWPITSRQLKLNSPPERGDRP